MDRIAYEFIVEAGVSRAACVGLSARRHGAWLHRTGSAGKIFARPADVETIFDLASVSKPFLAVTAARLVQQGVIRFETVLADLLEETRDTKSASVSLELLLAHRAGLEPHRALFAPLLEGRPFQRQHALIEAASARRPECTGAIPELGFEPVYSDLGYLLVGEALVRASGLPLDELVEREVGVPLGLEVFSARRFREHSSSFSERVAPTETVPWRGGEICGIVHDENAWALAGHGVAGHAGLFGTARAVTQFGAALLDALAGRAPHFLRPDVMARLVRERPGGSLRAGFDGKSGTSSAAGPSCSPATFGHLGFTGTSLWCDPESETVTVLLTNRVCPTRAHVAIRVARPLVHEALFTIAGTEPQGGW